MSKNSANKTKMAEKKLIVNELAKNEKTNRNIIVVDTNVLIKDPGAIAELRKDGNLLVIPWTVIMELDKLKKTSGIKFEVMEAIREIDRLCENKDPGLIIERGVHFSKLNLNKDLPDHQIIACLNYVLYHFSRQHSRYSGFAKVKMVTNDYTVKILARETDQKVKPIVEPYLKSRLEIKKKNFIIPTHNVRASEIITQDKTKGIFTFATKGPLKKLADGEPIIGYSDFNPLLGTTGDWKEQFVAIRRGDNFQILDPKIEASGIKAMHNSHTNWEQIIALHYLLDYSVKCVFLQGGAGSGKTLLALASALSHRSKGTYKYILVSRPTAPLDKDQFTGLVPGAPDEKMDPWLLPIYQNLRFILSVGVDNPKTIEQINSASGIDLLSRNRISIQSLDYIRGATFSNSIIIIDEAQNLTHHQIKTIITRVGECAKIIFTGDLSQIDSNLLDKNSSGLTYAIQKMKANPMIGVVNFKETLRSALASFAEEVL